jgi:TPP-dependent pyruvate/acetoin dehydrogenase alpha subunit
VGYAYAQKLRRTDNIVASFFGDGAVDEGVFHESMNFAALKALPIIFICENNFYAIHTHQSRRQSRANIVEKARAYGIAAEEIKDNDAVTIHERVSGAVAQLRAGAPGPFFFECWTYRMKEHVGPNEDYQLGYRHAGEAEPWIKNDPVKKLAAAIDPVARKQIETEVEAEIRGAFAFAENAPFPEVAELFTDVMEL